MPLATATATCISLANAYIKMLATTANLLLAALASAVKLATLVLNFLNTLHALVYTAINIYTFFAS
jgi:hypothetical protein